MDPADRASIESNAFESKRPEEILRWALEAFDSRRIALVTGLGAEGVAILDMLATIRPKFRVITLDTGRLPQETYDLMGRVREKYGIALEVMFPNADAVERMVTERGPNLFYESIDNRKLCCGIRKVEPLNRALATVDAWITGLRRDQSVTRANIRKVHVDEDHGGIIKINPLADWTWDQVMGYVKAHHVPYNVLHDQGFPSIGCAPCTRAIKPGEDLRAGRWWWERPEHKECGIHVGPSGVVRR